MLLPGLPLPWPHEVVDFEAVPYLNHEIPQVLKALAERGDEFMETVKLVKPSGYGSR